MRRKLKIILRTYRLLRRLSPGLTRVKLWRAVVAAIEPLAGIWFSAQIVGELTAGRNTDRLLWLAASAAVIGAILFLLHRWLDTVNTENEAQMWSYFSGVFAKKQMALDYQSVEDAATQNRMAKEKENLFTYGNGLGQFMWTFYGLIEGAISVVASLSMSAALFTLPCDSAVMGSSLWALPLLAVVFVSAVGYTKAIRKENDEFMAWSDKTPRMYRRTRFFGITLGMERDRAKDARLYRQDRQMDSEMDALLRSDKNDRAHRVNLCVHEPMATLLVGLGRALCYAFVALKAYAGAFGAGGVVQYAGALTTLSGSLTTILFSLADAEVYTVHLESLFSFLDIPNKERTGRREAPKAPRKIALQHVSFRYLGAEGWALRDVSLTLTAGTRLALVGRNGSGKSTLVKLLCRLYEPTEGSILLDGVDIREYDYDQYIGLLSVVFQDFSLFSLPLGQNVAAGMTVDRARAERCLDLAGFIKRLRALPHGLDTYMGKDFDESGVELSGGESQKLALARAMYRDAPLLILDEPTAALDPVAECEIYEGLDRIAKGKTALYISHRLASCRFCDQIAVLEMGRLCQLGAHEALLRDASGLYAEMWRAQAQYYARET